MYKKRMRFELSLLANVDKTSTNAKTEFDLKMKYAVLQNFTEYFFIL